MPAVLPGVEEYFDMGPAIIRDSPVPFTDFQNLRLERLRLRGAFIQAIGIACRANPV